MQSGLKSDATVDPDRIFSLPPIRPQIEMAAYEALWLNPGAWFKSIAQLFKNNPAAVPSELVDSSTISEVLSSLVKLYGERLTDIGIRVHGAHEYPNSLRDADHPIELLYYQGNWELVNLPSVAIVGTRSPTQRGIENARRIAKTLVREGFTIVSGLAKGIDTAAHLSAIESGGSTIAVIGTPLFENYPKENKELQGRIARDFLLISQVPFLRYRAQHFRANSLFFPARNITMSALTKATIIVEAGNTSGTLIQARAALAQGRKLFILESCFRNPALSWPAKYEKEGAIRVANVTEILRELGQAPREEKDC